MPMMVDSAGFAVLGEMGVRKFHQISGTFSQGLPTRGWLGPRPGAAVLGFRVREPSEQGFESLSRRGEPFLQIVVYEGVS